MKKVVIIGDFGSKAFATAKRALEENNIEVIEVVDMNTTNMDDGYLRHIEDKAKDSCNKLNNYIHDGSYQRGDNPTTPDSLSGELKQVLPKGCKWYFFSATGDIYTKNDGLYHFKCIASSERVARNKFDKQIAKEFKEIKSTLNVFYVRLLSYDNACKLIDFVNKNDKRDYAHITTGGVTVQASECNMDKIIKFIESLGVRYEICNEVPHKVTARIVEGLKDKEII